MHVILLKLQVIPTSHAITHSYLSQVIPVSFMKRQLRKFATSGSGMDDIQGPSEASKLWLRPIRGYNIAALSIQKNYRSVKGRKDYLSLRQKVVKIQAHIRGYQTRKKYKFCRDVGIYDKIVLRRQKVAGRRGSRPKAMSVNKEKEDEGVLKSFRKRKVDVASWPEVELGIFANVMESTSQSDILTMNNDEMYLGQGKGAPERSEIQKLLVKKEAESPKLSSQELPREMDEDTLSSDIIQNEMKDCCSIFFLLSRDYEVEKDFLIGLWLAGGCINNEPMELNGQKCFDFLLREGFILCSGTNFMTRRDRYRMNAKKINDWLNGQEMDSGFYLKWENDEYHNSITKSAEIQHISLACSGIDASVFQRLQQFNELKTLLFLGNFEHRVQQIPDHLFLSFKKLPALDLSRTHMKKLPSSLCYMIHLRYLDLSWTLIEWLPDTICSLTELQTLKLRGCSNLRGLPKQLKRLTKLRHLDVDVLRQLATMSIGIGSLVNLQTLSAFLVGTEDGCKVQELKELNNLTGDFCIAMLEHVGGAQEAKEANLNNKHHLKKLELRWTTSQSPRMDNRSDSILECLQPCTSLEELQIVCYEGSTFPHWVHDPAFDQLVKITFFKCKNVLELPLIEQLPSLKHLELVKMNGIKKIERRGKLEHVAFSRLERLEIDEMRILKDWSWAKTNDGDFKCLIELAISGCPELEEFHLLPCLSSIKQLEIRECPQLESLSDLKLPDSLEVLIVEDCPRVKKKFSRHKGEDWYKIQHVPNISICDEDGDDNDDDEC